MELSNTHFVINCSNYGIDINNVPIVFQSSGETVKQFDYIQSTDGFRLFFNITHLQIQFPIDYSVSIGESYESANPYMIYDTYGIHFYKGSEVCSFILDHKASVSFGYSDFNFCAFIDIRSSTDITMSIETSQSWFWNMRNFNISREPIYLVDIVLDSDLFSTLLYGRKIITDYPDPIQLLQCASMVQKILQQHDIVSILIGSLAEHINGIKCSVGDIDLMVQTESDVQRAKEVIESNASFDSKIDISYDNYNILNGKNALFDEKFDVTYMNNDGLLIMSLLKYYEVQNNPYLVYNKNAQSVARCMSHGRNTKLLHNPFVNQKRYNTSALLSIASRLCLSKFYHCKISCEPSCFKATVFRENDQSILCPVICNGPNTPFKLSIPFSVDRAHWISVDGTSSDCRLYKSLHHTEITLKQTNLPGVIECEIDSTEEIKCKR